jgi:indolepyruvate ferredoxin oxidoreductase
VKGFCPSFVTVHGAKIKKAVPETLSTSGIAFKPLPDPAIPAIDRTFNVIVTGVGGTGVGHHRGDPRHGGASGRQGLRMIDMAGLAQKGGAVYSHVRLANSQDDIHATPRLSGRGHLVLGCDLVVTGTPRRCWPP